MGWGPFQAEGTAEAEACRGTRSITVITPILCLTCLVLPMSHWEGILVYFQVLLWNVSFLKAGPASYVLSDAGQRLAQGCPPVIFVGPSLVVQWLRLCASTTGGAGWIPG